MGFITYTIYGRALVKFPVTLWNSLSWISDKICKTKPYLENGVFENYSLKREILTFFTFFGTLKKFQLVKFNEIKGK